MSMTIGRCAITRSPSVGSLRQSGDVVSFRAWLMAADVDEMNARVQQLRGLMNNPDEDTFPFTSSDMPALDGFYTDFAVEVEDSPGMLSTGKVPFSVRMRRVGGGYAAPLAEALVSSVVRTNSHAVASGSSFLVVPPTTDNPGNWYASGSNTDMNSEDGTLLRNTRTGPVAITSLPYGVLPADWYLGSSRVSLSYGGTYYPAVGQQIPKVTAVRVQNANLRVDVSSAAVITLGMWHDSAWESSPSFTIVQSGTFDSLASVKVLRNSPEVVTVRCGLEASGATTSPGTLDITLHRGHQTACCVFTPYGGGTSVTVSFRASAVTPVTAVTGGIEQTTADASGNKWFILNTVASTNDLVNGRRTTNAATANSLPFAVGMVASVPAAGDWSNADARDAFWVEYAESLRVVSR